MTLQEIHSEIKAGLPPQTFLIIQHSVRNYESGLEEVWECQAYADNSQPLDCMFMIHHEPTGESLVERAKELAASYKPNAAKKIAALKRQIAKLEGSV